MSFNVDHSEPFAKGTRKETETQTIGKVYSLRSSVRQNKYEWWRTSVTRILARDIAEGKRCIVRALKKGMHREMVSCTVPGIGQPTGNSYL